MRFCGFLLSSVLLGLVVMRPLGYAVTPLDLLGFWAFVLLYVAAPGLLLVRALGILDDDAPMLVGCGLVLGLSLETTAYVLSKLVGLPVLFYVYPLVVLAAALRRRGGRAQEAASPSPGLLALAMLAFFAQELHGLVAPARLGQPLSIDLLFHAGNAAELRNHWPLQDPRVAGIALVYHFFGYCLHAGAADWTGQAVAPILLVIAPGPTVALLALQLYNAGRVLLRSAPAGLVAAGFVLFHVDVGAETIPALGGFRSYLGSAIYGSTTTLLGFLYFVTLALALHRYLAEKGGRARGHLLALGLLSFAASGTKGSVMPVAIAGLLGLVVLRTWTARRLPRRALAALGVAAAGAAPMTAYLSRSEESFIAMFHFLPGSVPEGSLFLRHACEVLAGGPSPLGHAPCEQVHAPAILALTGVWALGYLGLGGLAGIAWLCRRRAALSDTEVWITGVSLAGAAAAYFLASTSGLSQLFFLYNGQIMLAVLGGGFLVDAAREPRRRLLALVLCGLGTLPLVMKMAWGVTDALERDAREALLSPSPLESEYGQGLAFLRERTPRDAIVVGRYGSLLVSAFGERRSFYETGYFTPHGHRLRREGIAEAFPERIAAQQAMWERPDRLLVTSVLGPLGETPVLLFVDEVDVGWSAGWITPLVRPVRRRPMYPEGTAAPLFANLAVALYRIDGNGETGSSD